MRYLVALVVVAALAVTACRSDDTEVYDITTLTIDGNDCTVTGPTSLPVGEHHFIVTNNSLHFVDLYVSMLRAGHTYDDLLEPQSSPGAYYPKPSWVVYERELPAEPSGVELDENQTEYRFLLTQPEHEHVVYLGTDNGLWFCSPLEVTAAEAG